MPKTSVTTKVGVRPYKFKSSELRNLLKAIGYSTSRTGDLKDHRIIVYDNNGRYVGQMLASTWIDEIKTALELIGGRRA